MTAQLPSRERLERVIQLDDIYDPELTKALARFALAAHEQEPVGEVIEMCGGLIMDGVIDLDSRTYREISGINKMKRMPLGTKFYTRPAPVPAVLELVSVIGELTSAIRSINRAPHHIAKGVDDDEPCYWQRKEWIDWILELASSADEKSRAAMLNGGKSERDKVRAAHAEWSQKTFDNVGPVGPLKHLAKEAIEAADAPDDLSEWADMQFLLWDAQRRAGITDEQINQAMLEKLAVNKAREWPEPKDGEPRLHIQSAPKV